MKHFSRTTLLLLVVGCYSAVAINAFAIHENKKEGENFDFEFDEFAGESSAASSDASSEESGEIEANVEMLPANFENVEPPGVDHMELTSDVVPAKMMREYQGTMVEV